MPRARAQERRHERLDARSSPGTWCKSPALRSSVMGWTAQAAWSSGPLLLNLLFCVIVWSRQDERDGLGGEVAGPPRGFCRVNVPAESARGQDCGAENRVGGATPDRGAVDPSVS